MVPVQHSPVTVVSIANLDTQSAEAHCNVGSFFALLGAVVYVTLPTKTPHSAEWDIAFLC